MPDSDAPALVTMILSQAVRRRASDVHLEPTSEGFEVRYRVDGLLETAERYDAAIGRSLVARLMVMAQLLTYRLDVPQEGRLAVPSADGKAPLDLRLAVMPTTHGLRAAVRLPADLVQPHALDELGLPGSVLSGLHRFADADAGMLLLSGPAGSGKTTTIYAMLAHIAQSRPGLSIISLEDPVERDLPGVTQIEVSPFGELTYERSLRSILRQDPQVLMLGEIRDAATASLAVQAALSGHRLISTMHAAAPAGAIARLLEMGLEPYQITSALFGVVAQRLLRRSDPSGGYRGRVPVAEMVMMDEPLRLAVLQRADADALERAYGSQAGFIPMRHGADELVKRGITDASEVLRILGPDQERA
ncbi:MAG: ATPase, T2SS/T4P/T4SS family [Tepidisphaeraceae bacterium]